MPKIITTVKADSVGTQKIPDTLINISFKVPEHKTLSEAHLYYRGEALVLEKALYESLPEGLYDALLYGMLTRKASLCKYSYDALEKRDADSKKEQIKQLKATLERAQKALTYQSYQISPASPQYFGLKQEIDQIQTALETPDVG